MKDFLKKLYAFVADLLNSIVSVLSVLIFSSFKAAAKFKETGNDDVVILANGPSLNDAINANSDNIMKHKKVAVNFFCNTDYYLQLKPEYYVVADDLFFAGGKESERFLEGLKNTTWPMDLFLPVLYRRSGVIQLIKQIQNVNIVWYNTTPVSGLKSIAHFLFNHNLGMPRPENVLCASAFLCIRMKIKKIYVLGADHSWLSNFYINDNNQLVLVIERFYGNDESIIPSTFSTWLMTQYNCFKAHEEISAYAKEQRCEIINLTKGSYIDSYTRGSIDEL